MFTYVIVVGYPKTGTTYLQNLLYNAKNINYFDKRNFLNKKKIKEKIKNKFNKIFNIKIKKNHIDLENNTFLVSRHIDYHITNNDLSYDKYQLAYLKKILFQNSISNKNNFIEIGVIRPGLIQKSLKNLSLLFENQDVTILLNLRNNIDFLRSRINHDAKIFSKNLEIKNINEIISDKPCKYPWCLFNGKCLSNCQITKVKTYCDLYLDYYLTYNEIKKYFDKIKINIYEYGIIDQIKLNFPNLVLNSKKISNKKMNLSNYKVSRKFILDLFNEDFKIRIKNSNYKLQKIIDKKLPDQYFNF